MQTAATDVKPFRHRVRVLTEVVNNTDEITLVTAAFQRMGWVVRPPTNNEVRGYPAKDRIWLIVEVRFSGYPRAAPKVAVKRIDELADKLQLGVWVRYAEIISFPLKLEKTYYINEMPAPWMIGRSLLSRTLRLTRIPRTTGLIRVPVNITETGIRSQLERYNLGRPFDPDRNSIQAAVSGFPEKDNADFALEPPPLYMRVTAVAGMILSLLCGVVTAWIPGPWKTLSLVTGIAMAAIIQRAWTGIRTFPRRILIGFTWAATFTLAGIVLESKVLGGEPAVFFELAAGTALLFFAGFGAFLALRDTGLARHLSWLLPLAVTILVPVMLGLGGMFDTEYLSYRFGIPADAVSVPTVLRLAVAGKSILIGLAVGLIVLAIVGWVRYFNGLDAITRGPTILMAITIVLLYLLASISSGLSGVDSAANNAQAQARAGRQPTAYFGLQGLLECVRPVSDSIPVYNGPLPVHRPVLSFGSTGTQLWIWDPGSMRAVSVPLQDVVVTPATGTPARC